jgi:hypothetical protein
MLVAEYVRQWLYLLIDPATERSVYAESCHKKQLPFGELSELAMGKWWRQLYQSMVEGATFPEARQALYAGWTTEDNWDLILTLAERSAGKHAPVSGYLPHIYALIGQDQDELAVLRLKQMSEVYRGS